VERAVDAAELQRIPGLADVAVTNHHVVCAVETQHLGDLLGVLGRYGIKTLTSAPPTLEELFMEQYRSTAAGPDGEQTAREAASAR
jgi:ABC-2 type transport system ATP-binding protein